MSYFLEITKEKAAHQLANFASKLDLYASLLSLTPQDVSGIKQDADYMMWAISNYKKIETYKRSWTKFKDTLYEGTLHNAPIENPPPPQLDARPAVVKSGIEKRFTSLAKRIKAHPNYTSAIGKNLGIETVSVNKDIMQAQPILKVSLRGSKVIVKWKKGTFTGIQIEKNSGAGFIKLDKDFNPPFVDNAPMPAKGQFEKWSYRAIYMLHDELTGQWSGEASITVGD